MTFEELDFKQQKAVEELRKRLKGEMDPKMYEDTCMFQRFLRARNFNINAAEVMLRNHIKWRKIYDVESILTDFTVREVQKYFPLDNLGFDKEGCPIWYWELGNLDIRGIWKCGRPVDLMKGFIQRLETSVVELKEQTAKMGHTVDKWVHVLNFENLSLADATHKPTLEIISDLVTTYEANYPERLKRAIVINASVVFSLGYSIIKPFVSSNTSKKIKIFGRDGWKEELLEIIDADVLPAFLGGSRTDPDGDPMCNTFIHHGGIIPNYYYVSKDDKTLANDPAVQKLTVVRSSKAEVKIHVEEPGSKIGWEFDSISGDIGFALLYRDCGKDDSKPEVLIPNHRIETEMCTEVRSYLCHKAGTYIIEFDNTYSWVRHKDVLYKTWIKSNNRKK